MTNDMLQLTYDSYLGAYKDITVDERVRLLRQSVTEDVLFTNPNSEGQGFDRLMEHIAEFQRQRPGASFKSNKLFSHHNQFLSDWTMYDKDGSAIAAAHSYGRVNDEGLITYLIGFF